MRDSYEGLGYAGRLSDKNNSALAHILARGTHGAHDDIIATSHKLMLSFMLSVWSGRFSAAALSSWVLNMR